jgi:thioredoxin 1
MFEATSENFRAARADECQAAIDAGDYVLVDFWSEFCGPCRSLMPVLNEIAGRHSALKILKVDIESEGNFADKFGVRAVPSLLLFKGGELVDRRVGKRPYVEIDRMVNAHA